MSSSDSPVLQSGDRLLIATTNPGKIREIKGILAGVPVALVTLQDFPAVREPEETGQTFAENARLKALYYSKQLGVAAVADDSGLAIDALGGAPGVHSARWHGTHYPTKFAVIYRELASRGL
ncbi:MAG TPA: non-canonical purine NTP pyrophosphatase, partial [Vicinamibacterales bacterium]|nr:non-canonical purine NTP pyrophosphatase [Vicinamibacterales bacterium]